MSASAITNCVDGKREFEEADFASVSSLSEGRRYFKITAQRLNEGTQERPLKRQRGDDSAIDKSSFDAIIKTSLDILTCYPALLRKDENKDELKFILAKVEAYPPATSEYRVFSKIIKNPVINLNLPNGDSIRFNSAAFVLKSQLLSRMWAFHEEDDEFSCSDCPIPIESVAVEQIKDYLNDPSSYGTSLTFNELLQQMKFSEYFQMEDLTAKSSQKLLDIAAYFPANLSVEQLRGVVSALNYPSIQMNISLKYTLEDRISLFLRSLIRLGEISEEILSEISNLQFSIRLDLDFSRVNDAQLGRLLNRIPIRDLSLFRCHNLTEESVKLSDFSSLESLNLGENTWVTDEVVHLLPTSLKKLNLRSNGITESSASRIGQMTQLEMLDLSWTKIGDAMLQNLPLSLNEIVLTGIGLIEHTALSSWQRLGQMTQLKKLDLRSVEGLEDIIKQLPLSLPWLHLDNGIILSGVHARYAVQRNILKRFIEVDRAASRNV